MKKNYLLFAAALAVFMTTAASAQTISLKANVPFSFIVNRATLPAGEYSVESIDDQGRVLAIRSTNAQVRTIVLANSCISMKAPSQAKLVFHRYGDRYFLNQVWVAGKNSGHELLPSTREKEMAKEVSGQDVLVAARR